MKTTIDFNDFRDAFRAYDRLDNFSRKGMQILFDYLEQYEQDTGEEMELDVIAICCDFSEATWQQIADGYDIDLEDCEDKTEAVREYLEDEGALIGEVPGGFVYRDF